MADELNELKQECKRLQYFESMYRQRILELEKEIEQLELYINDAKHLHDKVLKETIERLSSN